ncbi:hypothetical protein HYV49_02925 [Candidatus Pacearchaeota archaeon]|nr:hypothetical protein [Candidatus Pacearchaeota archaeon]
MDNELERRLGALLRRLEDDSEEYRSDLDMGYDTVARNRRLLGELRNELSSISERLSQGELEGLLNIAEELYPLNFYSGTGYGTCYGVRPVLNVVKNLNSQYEGLADEGVRIAYIDALCELYSIRTGHWVLPFNSYLDGEEPDSLFPNGTIRYMNKQLEGAKTREEKLKIFQDIVLEAKARNYNKQGK